MTETPQDPDPARFADLKKFPSEPAARVLAATSTKLATPLTAPASARVETVLTELAGKDAWIDMLRLIAVALPPREAVWWACLAARDTLPDGQMTPCLKAAEAWVFRPGDDTRADVQKALDAVDMDDDTALVASAALYAPGSLGLGDMAEHAAPAGAVGACVFGMTAAAMGAVPDPLGHLHVLIDRGLDIARGGNGRVPTNQTAHETTPAPTAAANEEERP